ncbi:MAG: arginine repressor [Firmicutes bacterium]|nr:arginine repressor [Bacillota bacterium]
MKARRQALILSIIKERPIATQDELGEALRAEGIEVTQATLSRDIKELGLTKIPTPDGRYRYALPHERTLADVLHRAERMFEDAVIGVDYTENLVIVKTLSGAANGVADALDDLDWQEVVGILAGDDTILIVVRRREQTEEIVERLLKFRR